jgi:radical SAM protein with 4Fe4S-binding SPASM domain
VQPDAIAAYESSRDFSKKAVRSACYAPHANLYFSMNGDVRPCCWSNFPIGNVKNLTIDEIWGNARNIQLRRALEAYDFQHGCGFCDRQTAQGWTEKAVMKNFDQ